jgi:hypothetical protein
MDHRTAGTRTIAIDEAAVGGPRGEHMPTHVRFDVLSFAAAVSLSLCARGGGGEADAADAATSATDGGFDLRTPATATRS